MAPSQAQPSYKLYIYQQNVVAVFVHNGRAAMGGDGVPEQRPGKRAARLRAGQNLLQHRRKHHLALAGGEPAGRMRIKHENDRQMSKKHQKSAPAAASIAANPDCVGPDNQPTGC